MGFSLEADSLDKTIYAFDNNLATSYKSTKTLTFGVKENVKAYTLLMNRLSALPLVCFSAPIPPTPFPSGEGGDQGYFMQGASPLASPG